MKCEFLEKDLKVEGFIKIWLLVYLKLYKQVIKNINCQDSKYVPTEQNSKINVQICKIHIVLTIPLL